MNWAGGLLKYDYGSQLGIFGVKWDVISARVGQHCFGQDD